MDAPETGPAARLDPGSLVIDRIETIALRAPLGRRFSGSAYSMDNRCTIVVRLTTADGITAETYSGDTDDEQALIVGIIHDELAPAILGRSARDPEGRWRDMEPATNNILRDRGLALQAIAALDTAIWDALGRAVGLPLYRLWGAVTDEVPISIIGGYYHLDAAQTAETVRRYVEQGFGGMKFKVGGRSPAVDAERFRVAREAAGSGLRADGGREPGLHARGGRGVRAPGRATSTCAGSRSPAAGPTTGERCATSAT